MVLIFLAIGDAIIMTNRSYLDFEAKPSTLMGNHGFEVAEVWKDADDLFSVQYCTRE